MVKFTKRLEDFEARYQREAFANLRYEEALARFEGLWAYARTIRPDLGDDWEEDIAPDLAIARAINGLPPT